MIVLDVQVSDEMAMQNVRGGCAKVEKIRIGLLVGRGCVKTQTKRAESPISSIAQGNALGI